MKTFVSILRGINVSGQKLIKMPELKKLYEDLGFKDVQTYIQSGNVIFKADPGITVSDLSFRIEKSIRQSFGFDVPVIIRTAEELKSVLSGNPFRNPDGTVADKIYITFLENLPAPENIERLASISFYPDRFFILGKEIYIDCAGGYGTTKLSNTFFEKALKMRATTRNWRTLEALIEMTS